MRPSATADLPGSIPQHDSRERVCLLCTVSSLLHLARARAIVFPRSEAILVPSSFPRLGETEHMYEGKSDAEDNDWRHRRGRGHTITSSDHA